MFGRGGFVSVEGYGDGSEEGIGDYLEEKDQYDHAPLMIVRPDNAFSERDSSKMDLEQEEVGMAV